MNNKLLAEYVGICRHINMREKTFGYYRFSCPDCGSQHPTNDRVDFTTWLGYGLLHDKITERGEWEEFRKWLHWYWGYQSTYDIYYAARTFHETMSLTIKSKLISMALEAGAIGG